MRMDKMVSMTSGVSVLVTARFVVDEIEAGGQQHNHLSGVEQIEPQTGVHKQAPTG
ncbi:hypothetical protein [Kineococcus aurantiacus]|uniref:hypothetical protein n=1 Tax=Kineococcus aurantiacus TaxID=37633 RepID=UPI0031E32088